jgi:hypothetical protein
MSCDNRLLYRSHNPYILLEKAFKILEDACGPCLGGANEGEVF